MRHRDGERDARARRMLREVEPERRPGKQRLLRVLLQLAARSRIVSASPAARSEIRSRSRPPSGRRQCAQHAHRSSLPRPQSPTSGEPRRSRRRRRTFLRAPRGDLLVRVAERHALAHERLRGVRREQQRIGRAAASRSRSNCSPSTSTPSAPSAPATSRRAAKTRRLVLLQVAVVGERQPLDRREQPGQAADRRARLPARELGDVGVQLLRHHRRARRGVLGQPREAELARSSRARAPRRSARGA